jgi:glycine dehydrogenase
MTLCQRVGTSKSARFFVAADVFAQTIDVVRTRAAPLGIEIVVGPPPMPPASGASRVCCSTRVRTATCVTIARS